MDRGFGVEGLFLIEMGGGKLAIVTAVESRQNYMTITVQYWAVLYFVSA
jgi:hypothetical protein